jgi:hypothetical protein
MSRRHFQFMLVLTGLLISLAGCEPVHRQTVRSNVDELLEAPPSESSVSTPTESKRFFKKNISSGGWSSEAREIEQDLGAAN